MLLVISFNCQKLFQSTLFQNPGGGPLSVTEHARTEILVSNIGLLIFEVVTVFLWIHKKDVEMVLLAGENIC